MDINLVIVGLSVILQFISAFLAIRLIAITGRHVAVAVILAAISLMAVWRAVLLYRLIDNGTTGADFVTEIFALLTSLLILIGTLYITRIVRGRRGDEEKLRRYHDTQVVINSLLRLSMETLSLDMILKKALELILSVSWLTFESRGGIFLVEEDPEVLVMKAQNGLAEPIRKACARIPFGRCMCGQAAATREPQFSACIGESHGISYEGITPHGHYCVPILFAGRVLGVVNIYLKEGHLRSKSEEEFLAAIANTLAGIILRRRAEEALLKSHGELELRVRERTRDLEQSELRLKALFQNANEGILVMDSKGTILSANQKACEIHGADENGLTGTDIETLVVEGQKQIFRERMMRLLKGESLLFETEHSKKGGGAASVEVSIKAIEIQGHKLIHAFIRDITEKKRLQAQLLHAQKMESIGTLAEGIAHEFKNHLSVILSFSEIILQRELPYAETSAYARTIELSARKASLTVSQLLSFARRDAFRPVPFDITTVIKDTLAMFSKLIKKDVVIREELQETLPYVVGDAGQIEQVLMNLMLNAKDAMPGGGELTIRSSLVGLESNSLKIPATIRKGQYIDIAIKDTGTGIREELMTHIFEPFFTTKAKGQGTGLGLAVAYSIVKDHNGYITVGSGAGGGTVFHMYLPASSMQVITVGNERIARFKGPETIMVVDDEVYIMEPLREKLLDSGFDVLVCDRPSTGVELFKAYRKPIAMVITDIVMPVMDGFQLIKRLRAMNPGIKVIIMSGYDIDLGDVSYDGFVKKPFDPEELVRLAKEILERDIEKI
ncbi:MAG TPA: PAS domain S-box protein [Dissulfurispiraceae bacterium]